MPLPPYDGSYIWNEYKITRPAFELNSFDKADMSPYLIHMTGKEAILGILQSNQQETFGTIKASKPLDSSLSWFDSEIVCFTESPTFTVDAFRYIKFRRWKEDHRFGIGFSKKDLVERNVRPVWYADDTVIQIMGNISRAQVNDENLQKLINNSLRLVHPLGETDPKQGFIWEREWRFNEEGDFNFNYSDIRIICCPQNESDEIKNILGDFQEEIVFVESWNQYDDISNFLKSRETAWKKEAHVSNELKKLYEDRNNLTSELNQTGEFEEFINTLESRRSSIIEHKTFLTSQIDSINKKISELKKNM